MSGGETPWTFWNHSQVPLLLQTTSQGLKNLRGEKLIDIHNTHEFGICNSLNLHSGITNYILAMPASIWIQSAHPKSLAFCFTEEEYRQIQIDQNGMRLAVFAKCIANARIKLHYSFISIGWDNSKESNNGCTTSMEKLIMFEHKRIPHVNYN